MDQAYATLSLSQKAMKIPGEHLLEGHLKALRISRKGRGSHSVSGNRCRMTEEKGNPRFLAYGISGTIWERSTIGRSQRRGSSRERDPVVADMPSLPLNLMQEKHPTSSSGVIFKSLVKISKLVLNFKTGVLHLEWVLAMHFFGKGVYFVNAEQEGKGQAGTKGPGKPHVELDQLLSVCAWSWLWFMAF